ncbi:MAG: hypothetical protein ACOYL3_07040 [Desulfuromonadaceae bacterium]
MSVILKANGVDVTTAAPLPVVQATSKAAATYSRIIGEGTYVADIPSSRRMMVGQDSIIFYDPCEGSNASGLQNGTRWGSVVSTYAVGQNFGFIDTNYANSTAAGHAVVTSTARFQFKGKCPLLVQARIYTGDIIQTNARADFGWHNGATTVAPTEGAYFRWDNTGVYACVMYSTGVLNEVLVSGTQADGVNKYRIQIYHDDVHFFINGVEVADIEAGTAQASITWISQLPIVFRQYSVGVNGVAPKFKVSHILAAHMGAQQGNWQQAMALCKQSSHINPLTGASTLIANNSTTAMTMTSNTAPAVAGLGGDFLFAAVAGAATVYPMFSVQVPVGYRFVCTGVNISTGSHGAAVTTTPTVLQWALGLDATAATLATTDTANTFATLAPRRVPLGTQLMPVSTVVGYECNPISQMFTTPYVCESGRYFTVILCMPVASATASQVIRGTVSVNGYWE